MHNALRTRGIQELQERPKTFTGAILLGYILVRYWNTWYVHGNKIIYTCILSDWGEERPKTFSVRICLNYFNLVATQGRLEKHLEGSQAEMNLCILCKVSQALLGKIPGS